MTDTVLTTLSTICWVVATVTLFALLAEWSSGTSWGITASIVRGVRGWADCDAQPPTATSPGLDPLPSFRIPAGSGPARAATSGTRLIERDSPVDRDASVELIDLGVRRLPPR